MNKFLIHWQVSYSSISCHCCLLSPILGCAFFPQLTGVFVRTSATPVHTGGSQGASEWHAADIQQEHSAHFPTALSSKTRRQDKTRVEGEIICRSLTLPVTSGGGNRK